jgi:TonB-dependent starch-binding outer membrane protein SusC
MKYSYNQVLKVFSLSIVMLLFFGSAFAQKKITGKVSDSSGPLPGATVQVKGGTKGTATNVDGDYSIDVPSNATSLVFSSIGFSSQEVSIGSRSTIDVVLRQDEKLLDEVVVTGYGAQAKKDITGAVATVNMKDVLAVPATNLAQAIQGRVAGVNVGTDNSPGGGVMVRIRGFGTVNDNSPLYVIDGTPTKGNLNTLNLNDIETMQVLKDASAASIYGSRAGNGVVIITTKRGKAGKPKFTYDTYVGVQTPRKGFDLANSQQYLDTFWRSFINANNTLVNGVATPNAGKTSLVYPSSVHFGSGATPVMPDYIVKSGGVNEGSPLADPAVYVRDLLNPGTRNLIQKTNKVGTNWFDEAFQPATMQNHQIGVSGATEAARYSMSLNYFDQPGIMKYTGYKRYSLRANTEFNVTKRVRLGENIQVAYDETVQQRNGNQTENNPISFIYRQQPFIPVYDIKGNWGGTYSAGLDNSRNPIADLYTQKDNKLKNARFFGNAFVEADVLKDLTARSQFGIDYNQFNVRNFFPVDIQNAENAANNSFNQTNVYDWTWTWYNTLTYKKSFLDDKLKLNLIAGTEAIKNYAEFFTAGRQRYASDDIENQYLDAGNAGTQTNSGAASNWNLASEFAKANVNLFDKYLLDLTVRRDRSSRFAPEFRTAIFPAVSVGWRLSNESFMKNLTWLSDLKLRAAYGQTGNQEIGNYNSFALFGTNVVQNFYDLGGTRSSSLQGYDRTQFSNVNAKWETTKSTDIGLDATVLKGALDISFDWFNRTTSDMLFPIDVQRSQGFATAPFQNIGEMNNKGIELGLNHSGKISRDFTYSLGGQFSTYKNMVIKTDGNPSTQYFGFTTRLPAMSVTQQGYPLASFFGYHIDGFIQSDEEGANLPAQFGGGINNKAGNFKFRDVNGDKKITAADREVIGSPHPDFTYGINATLGYKAFRLDLFGQGVQGNQIFNYTRYWTDFPTFAGNRSVRMVNESWEPGKTDAKLPILRSNDNISSSPSTYYLEDGSYFRLKNVQLNYTIPQKLIKKIGLASAVIYVQGQNLLTATKYTGIDPEINLRNSTAGTTGQDRHIGVDEGAYPTYKAKVIGLSVSF